MTDKFEVPEPLCQVYLTGRAEIEPRRVAVPVEDVPRIVRAEVERFREWQQSVALNGVVQEEDERAYLAARFPEESPSPHWGRDVAGPTERRERTFIPSIGGGQFVSEFTEADRARLDKLERFVTALAKWAVAAHAVAEKVGTFGDAPHAEAAFREVAASAAAAREYLR